MEKPAKNLPVILKKKQADKNLPTCCLLCTLPDKAPNSSPIVLARPEKPSVACSHLIHERSLIRLLWSNELT